MNQQDSCPSMVPWRLVLVGIVSIVPIILNLIVLPSLVPKADGLPRFSKDSSQFRETGPGNYVFSNSITIESAGWVINEIHADPDPVLGDANGDGQISSSEDEFIELVNNSGSSVDISGWTISDNVRVRHTFADDTVVPDRCAVVIFGGGVPTGSFGKAIVQVAGTLGFNNDGDTITLQSPAGVSQVSYTYSGDGGHNQSLTRSPDIFGPNPLVQHQAAIGVDGKFHSPGTMADGTPFGACESVDLPPRIVETIPFSGSTNVATSDPIFVQFSEAVTVSSKTFRLECPSGQPITFEANPVQAGTFSRFRLTPAVKIPDNVTCVVSVVSAEVVDQDGSLDFMEEDYNFVFKTVPAPAAPASVLISELLYDGLTPSTEGDEFVEICNEAALPVDLTGYKVGDEEQRGGGEGMLMIPAHTILEADACLVIAKDGADYQTRFGKAADFEINELSKYEVWSQGSWSLSNSGDEIVLVGPADEIVDSVAYRSGSYAQLGLEAGATAPQPFSLQRVWPGDNDSMPDDFVRQAPNPGVVTSLPPAPADPADPAPLSDGMYAFWGHLHAHTTYSDGAGPPHYALASARAAGLHFYALTDHGWRMSEVQWAKTLSQTEMASLPGQFIALRGVEWTHDSAGHINVFNHDTLLSRNNPDTQDLTQFYDWLSQNPDAIAQFNHPDPAYGGTFHNFSVHPAAAPLVYLQEIGNKAQIYTTYEPSFVKSNAVGWRIAPTINGDTHSANWGVDTPARTGIVAPALTRQDLLAALRTRRVFATEDSNLALALRIGQAWMGTVLANTGDLQVIVDIVDPDPEPISLYLYDQNLLLETVSFASSTNQWQTTISARPGHYYWIKAIQKDGDRAYSAPIWIEGQAGQETIYINEVLPSPRDYDWDGDGQPSHTDEWIELFNPSPQAVGLGGWQLSDSSGGTYIMPLDMTISQGEFVPVFRTQLDFALNNGGDALTLTDARGIHIDSFSYDHSPGYDESWCRLPDGGASWSDDCIGSPGGANWERPEAEPLTVKIGEAKQLTNGAWVKITGHVTSPPGLLGARIMYVQDETAGTLIYLPKDHGLSFALGDKVRIEGNVKSFRGEFEIVVRRPDKVRHLEPGQPPPPLPIHTTSLLEPYEGLLVQLQGAAVRFQGRNTVWLDDGTDPAKVFIRRTTRIKKPFIEPGTIITAVGIVSQFSDPDAPSRNDYRLLPRYQTDLVWPDVEPASAAGWPTLLPETGKKRRVGDVHTN